MPEDEEYVENLRKIRSVLIYDSLYKRNDKESLKYISNFTKDLEWKLDELCINPDSWDKIKSKAIEPKYVFCHPNIILNNPKTSLYYRGLSTLSIKAAKSYVGAIENLEAGNDRAHMDEQKALKMAQTYNKFISFIINSVQNWDLEDGERSIIATMGISLDGTNRNKVGELAEERIQNLLVTWLFKNDLVKMKVNDNEYLLINNIKMKFASDPDIAFYDSENIKAAIEIKGGIDPAGIKDRYGATTKSFEDDIKQNPHCHTYYLSGVVNDTLRKKVSENRGISHLYNIADIFSNEQIENEFLKELFNHSLRMVD